MSSFDSGFGVWMFTAENQKPDFQTRGNRKCSETECGGHFPESSVRMTVGVQGPGFFVKGSAADPDSRLVAETFSTVLARHNLSKSLHSGFE